MWESQKILIFLQLLLIIQTAQPVYLGSNLCMRLLSSPLFLCLVQWMQILAVKYSLAGSSTQLVTLWISQYVIITGWLCYLLLYTSLVFRHCTARPNKCCTIHTKNRARFWNNTLLGRELCGTRITLCLSSSAYWSSFTTYKLFC